MALSESFLARIPNGLALTAEERPTVDPAEALNGILSPVGGNRGFGLGFMWELLSGILSGGAAFSSDLGWPADAAKPQGVSRLLLAIDPSVSVPYTDYPSRVDALIDRIHGGRPAERGKRVSVPGQRGAATMARRDAEDIPISAALLTKLAAIGEATGVSL